PNHSEVMAWANGLTHGLTGSQVAQAFIHSPEYQINFLENDYQTILGRSAEPTGLAGWLSLMQQGMTEQQVLANFLMSPEFLRHQGSTNAGWISGLYHNLLGRGPDLPSLDTWLQYLQNGMTAGAIEWSIENSPEAYTLDVTNAYHNILGRNA